MVRCPSVEAATIVVLGGSEPERATLVASLTGSGLAARSETSLNLADGLPQLIIVTGADAAHLVAEARDIVALAEVPILAVDGTPAM